MRMFCWRSASSGSRRKALPPDGEQAVDRPAHDERDGHGDHQLDEAEPVVRRRRHHGASGHPPVAGSELVQARKRGELGARAGAGQGPGALGADADVAAAAGRRRRVIHQCVWMTPTPGTSSVQCHSVKTSVGSAQSLPPSGATPRRSRRSRRPRGRRTWSTSACPWPGWPRSTAAVPWLATLFELAATSIRLVTAISPKTSTTTATSASTSVKPASPPLPRPPRLASFMLRFLTAGAARGRPARCVPSARGRSRSRAGGSPWSPRRRRPRCSARPSVGASISDALVRPRALGHRDGGRAGARTTRRGCRTRRAAGSGASARGSASAETTKTTPEGSVFSPLSRWGSADRQVLLDEAVAVAVDDDEGHPDVRVGHDRLAARRLELAGHLLRRPLDLVVADVLADVREGHRRHDRDDRDDDEHLDEAEPPVGASGHERVVCHGTSVTSNPRSTRSLLSAIPSLHQLGHDWLSRILPASSPGALPFVTAGSEARARRREGARSTRRPGRRPPGELQRAAVEEDDLAGQRQAEPEAPGPRRVEGPDLAGVVRRRGRGRRRRSGSRPARRSPAPTTSTCRPPAAAASTALRTTFSNARSSSSSSARTTSGASRPTSRVRTSSRARCSRATTRGEQPREVGVAELQPLQLDEVGEAPHDGLERLALLPDRARRGRRVLRQRGALQQARVAHDRAEAVAHLVGDAGGQLAGAGEGLLLADRLLHPPPLRLVARAHLLPAGRAAAPSPARRRRGRPPAGARRLALARQERRGPPRGPGPRATPGGRGRPAAARAAPPRGRAPATARRRTAPRRPPAARGRRAPAPSGPSWTTTLSGRAGGEALRARSRPQPVADGRGRRAREERRAPSGSRTSTSLARPRESAVAAASSQAAAPPRRERGVEPRAARPRRARRPPGRRGPAAAGRERTPCSSDRTSKRPTTDEDEPQRRGGATCAAGQPPKSPRYQAERAASPTKTTSDARRAPEERPERQRRLPAAAAASAIAPRPTSAPAAEASSTVSSSLSPAEEGPEHRRHLPVALAEAPRCPRSRCHVQATRGEREPAARGRGEGGLERRDGRAGQEARGEADARSPGRVIASGRSWCSRSIEPEDEEGGDEGHRHERLRGRGPRSDGERQPQEAVRGLDRGVARRRSGRGRSGSGRAGASQLTIGTLSPGPDGRSAGSATAGGRPRAPGAEVDGSEAAGGGLASAAGGGCRRWRSCRRRGRAGGPSSRRRASAGAASSRDRACLARILGRGRGASQGSAAPMRARLGSARAAGSSCSRRWRWPCLAFLGSCCGRPAGHFVAQVSDLYVVAQYAKAMAEGHPFQYNAGEAPTTGATSLLHTAVLALAHAARARAARGSSRSPILLGAALYLASIPLAARVGQRASPASARGCSPARLVALGGPVVWGYLYGSDIALFLFLALLLLDRWLAWWAARAPPGLAVAGDARGAGPARGPADRRSSSAPRACAAAPAGAAPRAAAAVAARGRGRSSCSPCSARSPAPGSRPRSATSRCCRTTAPCETPGRRLQVRRRRAARPAPRPLPLRGARSASRRGRPPFFFPPLGPRARPARGA